MSIPGHKAVLYAVDIVNGLLMETNKDTISDKRRAILDTALELIARDGLLNVPTSRISRKAGVATGTLFVYFPTKEVLINELYLDLASREFKATKDGLDAPEPTLIRLKTFWFNLAHWILKHPEISRVMAQCEVSAVLTPETHTKKLEMDSQWRKTYFPNMLDDLSDSLTQYTFWAVFSGPIHALMRMRDKGEIEVTNEMLEQTYSSIEKAIRP